MITNSSQYKQKYLQKFKNLTDNELAEEFNRKVGIKYFNFAIQGFMDAMREELIRRKIDFSEIDHENSMSYKNKVKILNCKIIKEI
ncbi:hypothetical protein [Formosa maritima]|uniref:Uncharacterized protein n=1 Tax=Formosa maritima TaxID=2592046 RepID=A0A5D0GAJ7_9FLAO|nr:hypothetical protein [Formosa maritima]TYA55711.1 hypothetical protein FVF61_07285 [Formosa maritima]